MIWKLFSAIVAFAVAFVMILIVINVVTYEEPSETYGVSRIIDGDTIEMEDGTVVRLAGIDTPERGECGFDEATTALEALVLNKDVQLVPAGTDDTDRYGRLIRYVDLPKRGGFSNDVGFLLIEKGLAIARYDSRDGYGSHKRQDVYVFTDAAVESSVKC